MARPARRPALGVLAIAAAGLLTVAAASAVRWPAALGPVVLSERCAVAGSAAAFTPQEVRSAWAAPPPELAAAVSGTQPAALSCTVRSAEVPRQPEGADGLTDRARAVLEAATAAFGPLPTGGYQPGGVSSGRVAGSAHYEGRAVDVFFRPVGDPAQNAAGWALAHWLVAHASTYSIATVIYDDRIWTARRSTEGWRPYTHPSGDTANDVLQHRDHVHVDVVRGAAASVSAPR
jgi:hypothetical protein